jgi:hypothetical protein
MRWLSDRKDVGSSHHTVQRTALLYTKDEQAVRLEVHESPGELRLMVFGPADEHRVFDFPDGKSLTEYQVTYERGLLDNGFHLQAIAERRAGADRRTSPRGRTDRRR